MLIPPLSFFVCFLTQFHYNRGEGNVKEIPDSHLWKISLHFLFCYVRIGKISEKAENGPPCTGGTGKARAGWWEPLTVQYRAFSQELLPEIPVGHTG